MFNHLRVLFKKLIIQLRFFIYDLCVTCWGAPDVATTIIFNEQPYLCPGKHELEQVSTYRVAVCPKRHCEMCRVDRILKFIDSAKYSLDIAHLIFSSQILLKAVVRAYERGVCIRVATDREMHFVRGSIIKSLVKSGINVRMSKDGMIMHHKFCIIDGDDRLKELIQNERSNISLWQRRGCLMTGSLNWTKQGMFGNYENVVVTSNCKVISAYQPIFDFMWERFEILQPGSVPQ